MRKTTLYLPDELKAALTRTAAQRGVSEADIVRAALANEVGGSRPRPRGALFSGAEPVADRVDEALSGFGER